MKNMMKEYLGNDYSENSILNFLTYLPKPYKAREINDLDCIYLKGDLNADTLVSFWTPLKQVLQILHPQEKFYKTNRNGGDPFFYLKKLENDIDRYLPHNDDLIEQVQEKRQIQLANAASIQIIKKTDIFMRDNPISYKDRFLTTSSQAVGKKQLKLYFGGIIMSFEIKDGVLVKYKGKDTDVVIPYTVMSIGDWAFSRCKNLTNITIPKTIEINEKLFGKSFPEGLYHQIESLLPLFTESAKKKYFLSENT